jgi:ABC-2 type transport system ATP-binding protein
VVDDVAIRASGLTKHFGSVHAVEHVDLEVGAGEVFGFLGPNGAGKTTTIRLLLDEIRPTRGTAAVLGLDCHEQAPELHRRIGYLPGELALYDRLTAREHLDWLGRLRGMDDTSMRDELTERFGVELDRPIRDLSKGNRQKVGLVQAFMHRPEVAILDEPTSGLDPLVQDEFQRLLRELTDDGRTVFLSSHVLDEVQDVADRVGIIREGRMVTVSTVEELTASSLRRVEVRFARPVDVDALAARVGLDDVKTDGGGTDVRFSVAAPRLDAVLRAVTEHEVVDFVSEPADLEEIFLALYRQGDGIDRDGAVQEAPRGS